MRVGERRGKEAGKLKLPLEILEWGAICFSIDFSVSICRFIKGHLSPHINLAQQLNKQQPFLLGEEHYSYPLQKQTFHDTHKFTRQLQGYSSTDHTSIYCHWFWWLLYLLLPEATSFRVRRSTAAGKEIDKRRTAFLVTVGTCSALQNLIKRKRWALFFQVLSLPKGMSKEWCTYTHKCRHSPHTHTHLGYISMICAAGEQFQWEKGYIGRKEDTKTTK